MEQLNRVELRGYVGTINTTFVSEKPLTRLSIATNYVYKDKDGNAVIETTWHNVICWKECQNIGKGDKVELVGRIRNNKYIDANGNEHITNEIITPEVKKLDLEDMLKMTEEELNNKQ